MSLILLGVTAWLSGISQTHFQRLAWTLVRFELDEKYALTSYFSLRLCSQSIMYQSVQSQREISPQSMIAFCGFEISFR